MLLAPVVLVLCCTVHPSLCHLGRCRWFHLPLPCRLSAFCMTRSTRVVQHCILSLRRRSRGDRCVLMALCNPSVSQHCGSNIRLQTRDTPALAHPTSAGHSARPWLHWASTCRGQAGSALLLRIHHGGSPMVALGRRRRWHKIPSGFVYSCRQAYSFWCTFKVKGRSRSQIDYTDILLLCWSILIHLFLPPSLV